MMNILKKEKVSAYTHAAAIPVMIAGSAILVYMSRESVTLQIVSLIYGISAVLLFTASFLYHSKKRTENDTSIWRKLDHSAIFLLIAGTYTPMCYIYLSGWMRWGILIAQWSLVFLGIIFKVFFIKAPRIIGTSIYLLMGWLAVIPIRSLLHNMSGEVFFLLLAGGASYTTGAVIYAAKKPNPIPDFFGFHEIFHVLIIAGALFHLFMMFTSLNIYPALAHF